MFRWLRRLCRWYMAAYRKPMTDEDRADMQTW